MHFNSEYNAAQILKSHIFPPTFSEVTNHYLCRGRAKRLILLRLYDRPMDIVTFDYRKTEPGKISLRRLSEQI